MAYVLSKPRTNSSRSIAHIMDVPYLEHPGRGTSKVCGTELYALYIIPVNIKMAFRWRADGDLALYAGWACSV